MDDLITVEAKAAALNGVCTPLPNLPSSEMSSAHVEVFSLSSSGKRFGGPELACGSATQKCIDNEASRPSDYRRLCLKTEGGNVTVRDILTIPDPLLRERSAAVSSVDDEIRQLANDMLQTMYRARGVGLAAIQVGVAKRVVVIDLSRDENKRTPLVFINPVILETSKSQTPFQEGCLSVPGVLANVERPSQVVVTYTDLEGKTQVIKADGILATCLQHEIDHLEGTLFVDHLPPHERDALVKIAENTPPGWRPHEALSSDE
jgi:peptide deformylase